MRRRLFAVVPLGGRLTDAWVSVVPDARKLCIMLRRTRRFSVRIVPGDSALRAERWAARWLRLDWYVRTPVNDEATRRFLAGE